MGKIFTGSPKEGIAQIGKGIMNNAVGRFITHKNDPNTIIKSIFAKDKGITINLPNISEKANYYKNLTNKKNSLGAKDINPTSSRESIISNNKDKSNYYNKIDGSIVEYKNLKQNHYEILKRKNSKILQNSLLLKQIKNMSLCWMICSMEERLMEFLGKMVTMAMLS